METLSGMASLGREGEEIKKGQSTFMETRLLKLATIEQLHRLVRIRELEERQTEYLYTMSRDEILRG